MGNPTFPTIADLFTPSVERQIRKHINNVGELNRKWERQEREQRERDQLAKNALNHIKQQEANRNTAMANLVDKIRDKLGDGLFTHYNYCLMLARNMRSAGVNVPFSFRDSTKSIRQLSLAPPKMTADMVKQLDDPAIGKAMKEFLHNCASRFAKSFDSRYLGSTNSSVLRANIPWYQGHKESVAEGRLMQRIALVNVLIEQLRRYSDPEIIFITASANVDLHRELNRIESWSSKGDVISMPTESVIAPMLTRLSGAMHEVGILINS
ncbi:MAG: hypothetical protein JST93_36260 [Acidobacteria bacterium]|nr:hypothetical protein [Acidobacteriota bacterium]